MRDTSALRFSRWQTASESLRLQTQVYDTAIRQWRIARGVPSDLYKIFFTINSATSPVMLECPQIVYIHIDMHLCCTDPRNFAKEKVWRSSCTLRCGRELFPPQTCNHTGDSGALLRPQFSSALPGPLQFRLVLSINPTKRQDALRGY